MELSRKEQQLNKNAGFSLLELLIAVTILAIITIPMLHMFVTSAKINGKSRITLRATVLAQDVVEGLKAYHIDEIKEQFDTKHLEMLNASVSFDECKYWEDTDKPNVYHFAIKNARQEAGKYDVKFTLDANSYMLDDEGNSKYTIYPNGKEIAKLASTSKNSSFVYKKDYDDVALEDEDLRKCTRTLTLCLEDKDDKRLASVKCQYKDGQGNVITGHVYSDPITVGEFEDNNFYFLYYPLYGGKDIIEVDCKNTIISEEHPLNVYIVKQKDFSQKEKLELAENLYDPDVKIDGANDFFSVYTNLGVNLADGEPSDQVEQIQLNSFGKRYNLFDLSGIRNTRYGKAGTNDKVTEFIYDIVVEVYETGAYDDDFDSNSNRLVMLDGTKNY